MQKKTLQFLFLTLASSILFFCKTNTVDNKNLDNKEAITLDNRVKRTLTYNENKTKILILNYTVNKSPVITFNYQVIDAKTKKEIKKGVFIGQKIEWLDNLTLKGTPHIGMIQKQGDEVFKDNVIIKTEYITIKL